MKITDQVYQCQIPGQIFGLWALQCRLRIFQPHFEVQAVMITDMGIEMNWFIPYKAEVLAEQIVKEFRLKVAKLVWLEHFTPAFRKPSCSNFGFITFTWCNGMA